MDIDYFVQQLKYFWNNMNICLTTIDWVAISAIATFVMALAAFLSLHQNRKQLKELKRQWEELNTPRVALLLIKSGGHICLRLKNYSSVLAYDIMINIKIDPNNTNLSTEVKRSFIESANAINNMSGMTLEPNGTQDLRLFVDYNPHYPNYKGYIIVDIKYNDNEIYTKNVSLDFEVLNIVLS